MAQEFIFVTCQAGAEAVLKQEIAQNHKNLRFAFSRPGFLTFKWTGSGALNLGFRLHAIFARSWGIVLGTVEGSVPEMRQALGELAAEIFPKLEKIPVHIWERDFYAPEKAPPDFIPHALADSAAKQIFAAAPGGQPKFEDGSAATAEAATAPLIVDIIVVEANSWWVGMHRQTADRLPYPGGNPRIPLPEKSPSRAYLKIEEGLRFSRYALRPNDCALEIGSAPGGSCYALLKRGLRVVGIDPAEMAPIVQEHQNFTHIRASINGLPLEQIPPGIQWLLVDMNVAPKTTLAAIKRVMPAVQDSLLGILATVKMNDWRLAAEIPKIMQRFQNMGFTNVRACQLPSNRKEIFICGLTETGTKRKPKGV